ncbi:MAG: hypothetical protein XXXJIFNMEKO3_00809 [Candidatus Erwinia impunctatus]|nr:hypothetical protein XXXJIFNMEKO_00809 [Culicoides impunctatus]
MGKIALLFAMLFLTALSVAGNHSVTLIPDPHLLNGGQLKIAATPGVPVYIQIIKEERVLELFGKSSDGEYHLIDSYKICNYSGGLGPKRSEGDFKSPEGFYSVTHSQLKPDSRFYRAINVGFPNEYDRQQGYHGKYLMIHGDCVSIGCYAMTNKNMDKIYQYVAAALKNGQPRVKVSIYPFRMTESNMNRHRRSVYYTFWKQLQPGYELFNRTHTPPEVSVQNGQYVMNSPVNIPVKPQQHSTLAFAEIK